MYSPELYQESNVLTKRDARECLEEYAKEIKWKKDGATVIDIGCGDGGITTTILKSFIPNNFKELIGCDISEEMVQYANANHATDCIKFTKLDIEGDMPDQFREKFDYAFSSYALQWISNQKLAFSNIYDLLTNGGNCLLMFFGNLAMYDIFRELARIPRWNPWMEDIERFVSPYHDSQEPEQTVEKMMINIGFINVKVKCVKKEFIYYGEEIFKKIMFAINPYKIPLELQEEFWKDCIKVVNDMKLVDYEIMYANNPYKIPLEIQEDFWKDCIKVVFDIKLVDFTNKYVDDQFNVKINCKSKFMVKSKGKVLKRKGNNTFSRD